MGDAQAVHSFFRWCVGQRTIGAKTFPTYAPSTGRKIADVAKAGREDARRAVEAARRHSTTGPGRKMSGRRARIEAACGR